MDEELVKIADRATREIHGDDYRISTRLVIETVIRDALERGREGWIPVGERLPKPYVSVLIWRDDIPDFVGPIGAFWTGEKWCNDVMKEPYHCTHWHQLPNPPGKRG